MKKNIAFTLAEVLITLGVIGVIAVLTISELMTAYKAHRLRAQFLKSYSVLQQAFKQMEADGMSLDPSTYNSRFYKVFANYVNVAVDCGNYSTIKDEQKSVCFDYKYVDGVLKHGETYKTFNGSKLWEDILDDGQLLLMDGTNLMFENVIGKFISVDLNGYKNPPNRLGYDLFTFQFIDGELRTMGSKGTIYSDIDKCCNIKSNHYCSYNGIACAHRAKTEPDYFRWVVKNVK